MFFKQWLFRQIFCMGFCLFIYSSLLNLFALQPQPLTLTINFRCAYEISTLDNTLTSCVLHKYLSLRNNINPPFWSNTVFVSHGRRNTGGDDYHGSVDKMMYLMFNKLGKRRVKLPRQMQKLSYRTKDDSPEANKIVSRSTVKETIPLMAPDRC